MVSVHRTMKTILAALSTAALLVAAIFLGGQSLDFSTSLAVALAAGLAGWTFAEVTRMARLPLLPPHHPRLLRPTNLSERRKQGRPPARLAA